MWVSYPPTLSASLPWNLMTPTFRATWAAFIEEGSKFLMNAMGEVEESLASAMATYRVWLFG